MENRMISLERNTNETQIDLTLDLDLSLIHILRKLQQVNQGLYECLNQSNHTLNRIEQGNQRIYGQLDAVRTNTELTAYNSRVSALANSAMTYMYYDRNYR